MGDVLEAVIHSPQDLLCSQQLHMARTRQLPAPLWDEQSRCCPGKWLPLPAWSNYSCFERLKQIIKISRAIETIKHKKSLALIQLRREEALLLPRVLGEKLSTTQRGNPNKSSFLGNLCLVLSLSVRSASELLHWTHSLWLNPITYVLFSQQRKSSCFPKALEDPSDTLNCCILGSAGNTPDFW